MSERGQMFSESWYRVAGQRVALRTTVQAHRQRFRGEQWYVLRDAFTNSFYRLSPAAYQFVARLRREITVEQLWRQCLVEDPANAPGQEEVIQLLAQLYHANLIQSTLAPDSTQLFERYKREQQKEQRSKLLNFLFLQIPLFDPDRLLRAVLPWVSWLFNRWGALIWLALVGLAGKLAMENFPELMNRSSGALAPGNLVYLYGAIVALKIVHELGHALLCRHYGGEVHATGVMLLVLTPLPYVDVTSSWAFRSRWQRMLVAAGGVMAEFFVAALAVLVWANTGDGLLHTLAYNVIFIASVTTLLFNINPLLRYDGYFLLSDLLEIPNLQQKADEYLRYLMERYLFGVKNLSSPSRGFTEGLLLASFGLARRVYRVILVCAILLFLPERYFEIGLVIALFFVGLWGIAPLFTAAEYLRSNPRLRRQRPRAVGLVVATLALVIGAVSLVPVPSSFQAPGIVQATHFSNVAPDASGYVQQVVQPSGAKVRTGDPLIELHDADLDLSITAARAAIRDLTTRKSQAMQGAAATVAGIESQLQAQMGVLQQMMRTREDLVIRARQDGVWVCPKERELIGSWLERGTKVGEIIDPSRFRFIAVISQLRAATLFNQEIQKAEVRLHGEAEKTIAVSRQKFVQAQQSKLPSAVLGWNCGGEFEVAPSDPDGLQTKAPFFVVEAELPPGAQTTLLQNRSGRIRFSLPAEPLFQGWLRQFRQVLQKKYTF